MQISLAIDNCSEKRRPEVKSVLHWNSCTPLPHSHPFFFSFEGTNQDGGGKILKMESVFKFASRIEKFAIASTEVLGFATNVQALTCMSSRDFYHNFTPPRAQELSILLIFHASSA
ncbi:hypothetical protein CDAR_317411 [Caerostris darwini]|uniref:Uncharacterized protein n=1 Tax=Caerostris darwini TaxID=1538125 RepID=A0AAV4UXX7_9ARAC|nr:hypothetical protein CDAR_317411 [Caerostris darwini]